jgi:hypothetical protein
LLVAVILVFTAIGVVGWKLYTFKPTAVPVALPSPWPTKFQAARQLITEGKIADGYHALVSLQAEAPDFEPDVVATYIERSKGELANESALDEAAKAVAEKRIAAAVAALARVKSTIQKDKRTNIEKSLATVVDEKATAARAMKSAAGTLKEMQKLEALSGDVLAAMPDDLELKRLHEKALATIASIKGGPRPVAAPAPGSPMADVSAAYRSGDLPGAIIEARACAEADAECREALSALQEQQVRLGRVDGLSTSELKSVLRADQQLSGGRRTALAKAARQRLASELLLEASQHAASKRWKRASLVGSEALEVDPDNSEAKRIVEAAAVAAQDRFRQCYVAKDNQVDEAIGLCKEVLEMAPSTDPSYQRAMKLLETLKR